MFVRVSKYQDEHYVYMIASGCCCKALPKNDIKKGARLDIYTIVDQISVY